VPGWSLALQNQNASLPENRKTSMKKLEYGILVLYVILTSIRANWLCKVGSKMKIGVRQIAKLANVAVGTVDRALNGRKGVSESTRKRILEIAESAGYRPDLAARALSTGRVPILVGVCIPREIHYYFDELLRGILTEARRMERLGVRVLYRPTVRLGVEELERVSELLSLGVQALLIAPGNPAKLTSVINAAEQNGTRVVCVDTDAPGTRRSTVICAEADVAGWLAAELMSSFTPPKADVAIVTGMLDTEDHVKKTKSFSELYPKLSHGGKVVDIVEAHEEEEEAFQKCFSLLQQRPSLAGLYVNTVNCIPVCRAICARGLSGKIALITTDLFRGMVPYFDKGTIRASIHGRPFIQGELAMRFLVDHLVNGRPLPPAYYVAPHVVMRSNLRLFRETRQREDNVGLGYSALGDGLLRKDVPAMVPAEEDG
jgi:LacI family transcriptional regulator